MEKNPGFKITLPIIRRAAGAIVYGDALMLLHNQTKPYEATPGDSQKIVDKWTEILTRQLNKGDGCSKKDIAANLNRIVADFSAVEVRRVPKVKAARVRQRPVKGWT